MGSMASRLRRLEEDRAGGRCPECGIPPGGRGRIVIIDKREDTWTTFEQSFEGDPDERCPRCGQALYTVIQVVYEDPPAAEEGEGRS